MVKGAISTSCDLEAITDNGCLEVLLSNKCGNWNEGGAGKDSSYAPVCELDPRQVTYLLVKPLIKP